MTKKCKILKFDNKEYRIFKIPGKQVFRLTGLIGSLTAKPACNLMLSFIHGTNEEREEIVFSIGSLLSGDKADLVYDLVKDLFSLAYDEYDKVEDFINTILSNTKLVSTDENGDSVEKESISFDDFDFDELDIWIELIYQATLYNAETGLKKTFKKLQSLEQVLKSIQNETKQ